MKSRVNYQANKTPILRTLTDSQCQELVLAAEEVMFRSGVESIIPKPWKY